eukprot:819204-Prorocentrum_lima.AAC.1
MTSSLVGSEMCIRDRTSPVWTAASPPPLQGTPSAEQPGTAGGWCSGTPCLLYTSDAADDM